jgi:hypothetical protein
MRTTRFLLAIALSSTLASAKESCVETGLGGCATVIGREAPSFRFFQVGVGGTGTSEVDFDLLPKTLSATGFFSDIAAKTVGPGTYAYEINSPLWSDGAAATRYLVLPQDSTVTYVNDTDAFAFPDGAVLVKNMTIDTVEGLPASRIFVETQVMIYRGHQWYGLSYRWRKDQADADLVGGPTGWWVEDTIPVRTAKEISRKKYWLFAARSRADFYGGGKGMVSCSSCHGAITSQTAPYVRQGMVQALGFRTPQLRRPLSGKDGKDQIKDMLDQGYLIQSPGAMYDPATAHRWFALNDSTSPGSTLEKRVRSYLAANCSHCHGPLPAVGEWFAAGLDLRYYTRNASTNYVGKPSKGLWGLKIPASDTAEWINPGKPEYSTVMRRISIADSSGYRDTTNWGVYGGEAARRPALGKVAGWAGTGRAPMPPLATYEVNPDADQAVYAWIKSLAPGLAGVRNPTRVHEASPGGIRFAGGLLYLPTGLPDVTSAVLVNAKGMRFVLIAERPGVFRMPVGLGNGVYAVAAGGRRFSLAYFPNR